ncbi:cytochrome c biogenesis protein CcdA [Methylocucumis oryzae]|uniref:Cytochrome C biogenesis protein transmembrane domain-containing protein n=1 Tax=Methylocucumis oryzae TaxID=1632867 RepID=A0A0F3IH52_9GAMM|nr:protein-disulfide reductase DsbD domain-containing protein [Methylocucumis oryzae]KJV06105.1 hypothetical protein VZ94_13395 [Methylocucumis oryzae]
MNKLVSITLLWLLLAAAALAESPKADLTLSPKNIAQWPAEYTLLLTVPADHHAYLNAGDKNIYIPVALDPDAQLAAAGLTITNVEKPTGVYDQEVAAQVLRGQSEFTLTLAPAQQAPAPTKASVPLTVRYQLCNDVTHVCYRPQTASLDLSLPAVATSPQTSSNNQSQAASTEEQSTGLMDKLLKVFENNKNNTALMFALMFLAGLLSVATPCVYPMLPITSMFILNRAGGIAEKEKLHALVYLVGIIGTYMVLGLVAGMTGGAFNAFMQSATINLAFAAFFAFFCIIVAGIL